MRGANVEVVAVEEMLSITPGREQPGDSAFEWIVAVTPTIVQKILHVAIYGLMALLWAWTLEGIEQTWLKLGLAFLLSAGLGIFLEWYQTMVPGRFGTITDIVLNALGTLAGLAAALLIL